MNVFLPTVEAEAQITRNALGGFTVSWRCPRCKYPQYTSISAQELVEGATVECENIDACGLYESSFEVGIEFGDGLYTHQENKPLTKVAQ